MSLLLSHKNLESIRQFGAEILACAVLKLFPNVQLMGGSFTHTGFYYDFIFEQPIDRHMLDLIEAQIRDLVKEKLEVRQFSMMRENAHTFLLHHKQFILAENALDEETNIISLIQIGNFFDLCPEIDIQSTDESGVIKLLEINAFQKSKEEITTRVIGTAFTDNSALKSFIKAYEKLKKIDHRVLGPELGLFGFSEATGSIECFWYPKGEKLRSFFRSLWEKECQKQSIEVIASPLVVKESFLSKKKTLLPSFSWQEDAYVLSQEKIQHHLQFFKQQGLIPGAAPIRLGEIASIYEKRTEALEWGLFSSSSYQSDLITALCREEQVAQELIYSLQFIQQTVRILDFEAYWYLVSSSVTNSQSKQNRRTEQWLKQALQSCQISYLVEKREEDNSRIEMRLTDSLGREWLGAFIQLHFLEGLSLEASESIVLARSLFSSLDRWIALLVERSKGVFPLWLAPEQIRIIPVGAQNQAYAEHVYQICLQQGFKARLDSRLERLGAKVHAAEKERIPYILIVGDSEETKKRVTVRTFQDKIKAQLLDLDIFVKQLREELASQEDKLRAKPLSEELKSQLES